MIDSRNITQLLVEASAFKVKKIPRASRDAQIMTALKARDLVLAINKHYKESNDPELMSMMKDISKIKQQIERKIKRPLRAQDL